jgi:hypothetical protein
VFEGTPVHDVFEILGLPMDALPSDIRRAYARRPRRLHPDFCEAGSSTRRPIGSQSPDVPDGDIAVDFSNVSVFVDRIQAAFFADES